MASEAGGDDRAPQTKVFISYSRRDIAFADRLDAALKKRGFETFIDRSEIYAFEDWWREIERLIGRADTIIFLLSPDSVKSEVAIKEIAYAASLNKRFAPIVCRQVGDDAVPAALRKLNFIFFDDAERFEAGADLLAEALETDIEWIRQHTDYGEAERRWYAAGRPNGLLLHSPTLEVAEHWLLLRPRGAPEPTAGVRTFVAASRQRERAAQRLRRMVQVSIFTLLVAIILGLVGWINQDYLKAQWHWWTIEWPYAANQIWPHVLTAEEERALKPGQSFRECARNCSEMVVVPAGTFMMGSSLNDPEAYTNEVPLHKVTIARPFAVGKYDVTFDDWNACVKIGECPEVSDSGFGRGRQPVINVSWNEAQHYVTWLTKMTGKTYRLLSESEWEYAARGGTTTEYYWGNDIGKNNADCDGCGSKWDHRQPAPAGSFSANAFGLYDMAGNVWQWIEDCTHDNYNGAPTDGSAWTSVGCKYLVVRGGSWVSNPQFLRSAYRARSTSGSRGLDIGFRIARTLNAH